jgi:N-methylhydantoinase A
VVRVAPPGGDGEAASAGERRAAPVYDRAALGTGVMIAGPAIITELDSTTWVDERSRARVHASGALLIEVDP